MDALESIIIELERDGEISIQEVMELMKKSRTTAWRYMQLLVDCGAVSTKGNTNNARDKKTNSAVSETSTEEKRKR